VLPGAEVMDISPYPAIEEESPRRRFLSGFVGAAALVASNGIPAAAQLRSKVDERGTTNDAPVSVWRFLSETQIVRCRAGELVDCTAAFEAAQVAAPSVLVPPGTYGLAGLRITSGRSIIGFGEEATILAQLDPTLPAIDCRSDEQVGQLIGVELLNFTVRGHPRAQRSAVLVAAYGTWAVLRSRFSFYAKNTLTALEVQGADAANVYRCQFQVVSENTRGRAVFLNGGGYNSFDLFLTQCGDWALDMGSSGSSVRVVSDNCIIINGQNNLVWAQVEEIHSVRAPSQTAIADRGYGNTFFTPCVNISPSSAAKLTFAFKAFHRTIFLNPQIIGSKTLPHPFEPSSQPFSVFGGRATTLNKMEAIFNGHADDRMLSRITFVGDVSDYLSKSATREASTVQHGAPSGTFVCTVHPTTQAIVWEPTSAVPQVEIAFAGVALNDGRTISLSTSGKIDAVHWPTGVAYAGLPTTLAAGQRFRIVYIEATERWHLIA
jgi:hypothetical protein